MGELIIPPGLPPALAAAVGERGPAAADVESVLRAMDFTDLYISEGGEAFMRGYDGGEDDSPLVGLPEDAMPELETLHSRVCHRGREAAEFFMNFAGMRFRVTRIETVGEKGRDNIWYTLRRTMWPIPRIGALFNGQHQLPIIRALGNIAVQRKGKGGLILIAGATGSGKTTTACSLLQEYLYVYGDIAVTIEDPVELAMDGFYGRNNRGRCFQTEVKDGNFAASLKAAMRHTPTYIMLGEVRDSDGASQAIRAAVNGHIVITTIHAGDPTQAIQALLKFVAASENMELAASILADGISAVIHQTLTRIPGQSHKSLGLDFLFVGHDTRSKGIRSTIRSGNMHTLGTTIEMQRARVMQNKLPTDE